MAIFPIVVTVDDAKNPILLVRLLRKLSEGLAEVSNKVADLIKAIRLPSVFEIRDSLQSSGSAPLNVTNLRGMLSDPQPSAALRYTTTPTGLVLQSLRDTQFILVKNGAGYDLVTVLGGNPNTLFTLVSGASGGTSMTTDTDQTTTAGTNKTFTSDQYFLSQIAVGHATPTQIIDALSTADVNSVIASRNTNAVGTAAAGVVRASGSTALISLVGHGAGRVLTRCGITLGSWNELFASAGSGILLDILGANPIVFGTNNIERGRWDATGLKITTGALTYGDAASKIIPGATSLSHRNNADSADNLLISDAGVVTVRSSLVLATAASKVIPGATSLSLRDNADSADNLIILDAGGATFRGALTAASYTQQANNGAQAIDGFISEEVTLSLIGLTTDSSSNLLPVNSRIKFVNWYITQAITGGAVVTMQIGDGTVATRFASTTTLTLGGNGVGQSHMQGSVVADASGPVQTTAAAVRITMNAIPTAGKVRLVVFYEQGVAPTS